MKPFLSVNDPSRTPNDIDECTTAKLGDELRRSAVGVGNGAAVGHDKERGISDRGFLVTTSRGDVSS